MTLRLDVDDLDRLKVRYRVGAFTRGMIGLLAILPLWATLGIFRELWDAPFVWTSAFFAALGLGAALVGVGMLLAALGSNDETLEVDRLAGTVTRADASALGHRSRESRPIAQISRVETGVTEWSDSPTYHLAIHFGDGSRMKFGSSNLRAPIDELRERLVTFLEP